MVNEQKTRSYIFELAYLKHGVEPAGPRNYTDSDTATTTSLNQSQLAKTVTCFTYPLVYEELLTQLSYSH